MPVCPAGHESPSSDFCDTCGMRIGAPATGPASTGAPTAAAGPDPVVPAEYCPRCGATQSGRFCEACGFDFDSGTAPPEPPGTPAPAPAPSWTAVVTADRAYYDRVLAAGGPDADTLDFPAYCPPRRFQLTGTEMRIGRRSVSRGLDPEIDLSGPPADPGVSHLHAVLIAQPDGSWAVLDPGSANGTQVNGGDIPGGVKVPLHRGDQVHVGAWTVLTIVAG
jgi:hypothetical protein